MNRMASKVHTVVRHLPEPAAIKVLVLRRENPIEAVTAVLSCHDIGADLREKRVCGGGLIEQNRSPSIRLPEEHQKRKGKV